MRCCRTAAACFAALLLSASAARAQDLWALDLSSQTSRILSGQCVQRPVCRLAPPAMNAHTFPFGGADLDTCDNTLWWTDGRNIVNADKNCTVICPGIAIAPGNYSGLAVDSIGRIVYAIDPIGTVYLFRMSGAPACVTLVQRCALPPATPNDPYTGLAYDGFSGNLWAVTSTGRAIFFRFVPGLACSIICSFPMQCPTPAPRVTGLAYDSCNQLLYAVTEPLPGTPFGVLITARVGGPNCGQTVNCCVLTGTAGPAFSGLAFEPMKPIPPTVSGCSGPGCPPCTPTIGVKGMPTIGTSGCFSVTLSGLPCPSNAFLFVSVGPCAPFMVPGICGPVWVNLGTLLFILPAVIPPCPPPALCGGSASFPLGIPLAQALCGLDLCMQGAAACPAGGISVTSGLSIKLVGP
jgi:hypothetical protein